MTGGSTCMVAICRNSYSKAKRMGEKVRFFTFPKDEAMRNKWISRCYRGDYFDTRYKRICSAHFRDEDYQDLLKSQLLGTTKKLLKKTAVPSLNLLLPEQEFRYKLKEESER